MATQIVQPLLFKWAGQQQEIQPNMIILIVAAFVRIRSQCVVVIGILWSWLVFVHVIKLGHILRIFQHSDFCIDVTMIILIVAAFVGIRSHCVVIGILWSWLVLCSCYQTWSHTPNISTQWFLHRCQQTYFRAFIFNALRVYCTVVGIHFGKFSPYDLYRSYDGRRAGL